MEPRMSSEPGFYAWMFVGTIIVYDEMQVQFDQGFTIYFLEKTDKFFSWVIGRQGQQDLPGAARENAADQQIGAGQMARTLRRAPFAQGQQLRQAAIGGAAGRQADQRGAVGEVEAGADEKPDAGGLRPQMPAHHAGQGVAVGNRDRRVAERGRLRGQFLGVGGAAQKAEIAGDL